MAMTTTEYTVLAERQRNVMVRLNAVAANAGAVTSALAEMGFAIAYAGIASPTDQYPDTLALPLVAYVPRVTVA